MHQFLIQEKVVNVTYQSSGIRQNLEEQILSIRQPQVQEQIILEDQPVSQITENLEENVIVQDTNTAISGWFDPLAQSFFVNTEQGSDGVFITSGDVYFRSKDPDIPVTVQIRTMRDGSPTNAVVPFGETQLQPDEVLLSQDGSVATRFTFSTPVYLQSGTEYALVLISPTSKYLTYITRMGEVDLLLNSVYNRQPYLGSLFKSQNNTTWDASQLEDLKFKLFSKIPVNTPSTVIFYNNELPMGKIRKSDPLTVYSKRQTISIASTSLEFAQGTTMIQGSSSRSGNVFSSGGPVDMVNATTSLTLTGAGIGIPEGTFTGIGFTTLSGNGSGLEVTLNTTVASGVGTITVTNGGSGYQVGDLLLSNKIGDSGSGARVTVGIVTMTNKITLDDVTESFVVGTALTHTNGEGVSVDITAPTAIADSDIVRDGFTFKVDHRNHGMHAGGNVVKIGNVIGDVLPTSLTSKVDDDSTTIDVVDGTNFASFEGVTVSEFILVMLKLIKKLFLTIQLMVMKLPLLLEKLMIHLSPIMERGHL